MVSKQEEDHEELGLMISRIGHNKPLVQKQHKCTYDCLAFLIRLTEACSTTCIKMVAIGEEIKGFSQC